jgi:hypothetical protein
MAEKNVTLKLLQDIESGKIHNVEDDDDSSVITESLEVGYRAISGGFFLVTYQKSVVRLLKKVCKFKLKDRRYECSVKTLPSYDDIRFVEFSPKPPSASQVEKIEKKHLALTKREIVVGKMVEKLDEDRESLKGLISKYGIKEKMGLSQDAYVICYGDTKLHARWSTHAHTNNSQVLALSETNEDLRGCIDLVPMVNREKLAAIWDKLPLKVQLMLKDTSAQDAGLHEEHLKGEVCAHCGRKLTTKAKKREWHCKICEG